MTYQYAVWSKSELMFAGEIEAPNLDQATIKAAHEGARQAYQMQLEWDPFELQIALRLVKQKHNRKPQWKPKPKH